MGQSKSKKKSLVFYTLPTEMLEIIAQYLNLKSFYCFSLANKHLYEILWNNSQMWTNLLQRDQLNNFTIIPSSSSLYSSSSSSTTTTDSTEIDQSQIVETTNNGRCCRTDAINIYKNIVEACTEFEKELKVKIIQPNFVFDPRSEFCEVHPYTESENYLLFQKFSARVSKFEEYVFILKDVSNSPILRGCIIVFGLPEYEQYYSVVLDLFSKDERLGKQRVKHQVAEGLIEDVTIADLFDSEEVKKFHNNSATIDEDETKALPSRATLIESRK